MTARLVQVYANAVITIAAWNLDYTLADRVAEKVREMFPDVKFPE